MGVTLHLHTECLINGIWHHYSNPTDPRLQDTCLFGLLGHPSFPPEPVGAQYIWPSDLSEVTRLARLIKGKDGYCERWMHLQQIVQLLEEFHLHTNRRLEEITGYFFGNQWAGLKLYPGDWCKLRELGLCDVRFVYWFS